MKWGDSVPNAFRRTSIRAVDWDQSLAIAKMPLAAPYLAALAPRHQIAIALLIIPSQNLLAVLAKIEQQKKSLLPARSTWFIASKLKAIAFQTHQWLRLTAGNAKQRSHQQEARTEQACQYR